ncbi:MAG: metallophosphoesterase [Deltaproteobacteria bacterium]|nr:metallophosphoesterase [Deltaproteobacteria bacterium]
MRGLQTWMLCICLGLPATAGAGIIKGPYLQDVRTDSMVVAVETDATASCTVRWGEGLSHEAPLAATGNHHEGRIQGLEPSRCYFYQVDCGSDSSPQSSLCTAALPGEPFSFVLFGDTRSDHASHQQVVDAIRAEGVDFYINTGDLVSNGENEADWVPFFEVEAELLRELPLFPVVGNHDEEDGQLDNYERLFAPPTDRSDSERYYAFTYANARFIALDNQSSALLLQKSWFEAELDAAVADPSIEHIFVLLHENMYSSKDGRSGDWYFRSWRNTMLNKGVKYVFSGHDHYYDRGVADNGLPYLISGGGGAPLYDSENATQGDPIDVIYPAHTVLYSRKIHHYLRIDIHGPHFAACAKDAHGVAFDCFEYGEMPTPDGGQTDGGEDGGQTDGGEPDAGQPDGGMPDAGQPDAGQPDAGQPDGGEPDAGQPDAGQPDAGADEGGADEGGADEGVCDCSGVPYDPICGEDGVTYANMCELDCAQMGMRHRGECQEDPGDCECPDLDEPVCGADGVTYRNPCVMECMGVEGAHEGPCTDGCDCSTGGRRSALALVGLVIFTAAIRSRRRRRFF